MANPATAVEQILGQSLRQLIDASSGSARRGIPPQVACWIAAEVARALEAGRARRRPHGTLSPDHVFISADGALRLVDLGGSATASYLSPEQAKGQAPDLVSDLFSLGSVLWECLTGRKFFNGEDESAILERVRRAREFVPPAPHMTKEVPETLAPLIAKCLSTDRGKRYDSVNELIRDLERAAYPFPAFERAQLVALVARKPAAVAKPVESIGHWRDEKPLKLVRSKMREPEPTPEYLREARPDRFRRPLKLVKIAVGLGVIAVISVKLASSVAMLTALAPRLDSIRALVPARPAGERPKLPNTHLVLRVNPEGGPAATITLNGAPVDPATGAWLIYDLKQTLAISKPGFAPYRRDLYVSAQADGASRYQVDADLIPIRGGTLNLRTTPDTEAKITNGVETWVKKTPIRDLVLPAGDYTVSLPHPKLPYTKTVNVSIRSGSGALISEDISP